MRVVTRWRPSMRRMCVPRFARVRSAGMTAAAGSVACATGDPPASTAPAWTVLASRTCVCPAVSAGLVTATMIVSPRYAWTGTESPSACPVLALASPLRSRDSRTRGSPLPGGAAVFSLPTWVLLGLEAQASGYPFGYYLEPFSARSCSCLLLSGNIPGLVDIRAILRRFQWITPPPKDASQAERPALSAVEWVAGFLAVATLRLTELLRRQSRLEARIPFPAPPKALKYGPFFLGSPQHFRLRFHQGSPVGPPEARDCAAGSGGTG